VRAGNPKKFPIVCFAPDKKYNLQDFQNQRYIGIFMSLREREREIAIGENGKGKKRERAKVLAILFLNHLCQMKNPPNIEKRVKYLVNNP
jgi:hypothetical protein